MQHPRFDLYAGIHKALRSFMADTLTALGRLDSDDAVERAAVLAQLDALLDLLEHHACIEDEFIHPAMRMRAPGSERRCGEEHDRQRAAIRELRRKATALESAGVGRAEAARGLYRDLALAVAENFAHMHEEETAHNAVLWSVFSDDELASINDRIVASLAPEEAAQVMRWMAPSLTPVERAALFGALRAKAPSAAFQRLLEAAREQLSLGDWNKLVAAIAAGPVVV